MADTEDSLPSADVVLSSMKSCGIFDEFRKTCLQALESDPEFLKDASKLEQSCDAFLTTTYISQFASKSDLRSQIRQTIKEQLSKEDINRSLDNLIGQILSKKEREIQSKISNTIEQLVKQQTPPPETASARPSVEISVDGGREGPKETALDLLDAFGVSSHHPVSLPAGRRRGGKISTKSKELYSDSKEDPSNSSSKLADTEPSLTEAEADLTMAKSVNSERVAPNVEETQMVDPTPSRSEVSSLREGTSPVLNSKKKKRAILSSSDEDEVQRQSVPEEESLSFNDTSEEMNIGNVEGVYPSQQRLRKRFNRGKESKDSDNQSTKKSKRTKL